MSPILKFFEKFTNTVDLPKLEEEKNILNATIVTVNLTAVPQSIPQQKYFFFSTVEQNSRIFRYLATLKI